MRIMVLDAPAAPAFRPDSNPFDGWTRKLEFRLKTFFGHLYGDFHRATKGVERSESWPDFFLPWSLEALTYQAGLVIRDSKREFPPQHSQREIPLRVHASGVPKPQKVYS